jgi:RNA polymerase sigma-70 factor, ECF subfamily
MEGRVEASNARMRSSSLPSFRVFQGGESPSRREHSETVRLAADDENRFSAVRAAPTIETSALPNLLPRIAQGDAEAIRACIDRYGGLIFSLAQRYARENADDLVQEIMIQLWNSASRFDESQGSEVAFVAMIAKRRLIDDVRYRARRPAGINVEETTLGAPEDLYRTQQAEWSADIPNVLDALRTLPQVQQQAIAMSVIDQSSHDEIATELNVPLGTVKSYIRRGIETVRQAIQGRPHDRR